MFLYQLLERWSIETPEKTAVRHENKNVSYADLKVQVDCLALGLQSNHIPSNVTVGLLLHNSIEFITALLALEKNGNTICLMSVNLNLQAIIEKVHNAEVDVLIMENYLYEKYVECDPHFNKNLKTILRKEVAGHPLSLNSLEKGVDETSQPPLSDRETLIIQCSSGTTGLSKMVYRTESNIRADMANIMETMNYRADDVVYCTAPLNHGYGLTMGLLTILVGGMTIHLERWFRVHRFNRLFESIKPTVFIGVPEDFIQLTDDSVEPLHFPATMRFLCSGSPLIEQSAFKFKERYGKWIVQVYGMMEASAISIAVNLDKKSCLSVGPPAKNVDVKLDSEEIGGYHEILVKSQAVSKHYVVRGEKVPLPCKEGWFRTGDLGRKDDFGNLYIMSRKPKIAP